MRIYLGQYVFTVTSETELIRFCYWAACCTNVGRSVA